MNICTTMVKERKKLESILENADLKSLEDAIVYADALTKIIWDHQMLGLVFEYYDEKIVFKGARGKKLTKRDDVVIEFLSTIAPFPDLRVHITESFCSGNETEGFNVYQRSYLTGTNRSTSKFGPPTYNKLDEANSMGQNVYCFKKVQGKWKVCTQYYMRSESTIEALLKNEIESK